MDSLLIIDVMDLFYIRELGGFCLVFSDSDFICLVVWLCEVGVIVYGFGEKKILNLFVVVCDKFIYIEILCVDVDELVLVKSVVVDGGKVVDKLVQVLVVKVQSDKEKLLFNFIVRVIEDIFDDEDWVYLGVLG